MEQIGGYDLKFNEDVPDQLICAICLKVLKEPVLLVECGHTFCHSCFEQIKENAEQRNEDLLCPTDRTKVDVNKVFDNKAISRLVLDLIVKCNHYLDGCQWTGEIFNLERHLEQGCKLPEEKRTTLQPEKWMETYEKQLAEKEKRMQSYEKRLEENEIKMQRYDNQLQLCQKSLQEKENRLLLCEKQLNTKEYEALLAQLDLKEKEITMLKEKSRELTGPSQYNDDPEIIKARCEWNQKYNDQEKSNYLEELCRNKQEQLLIKWLKTGTELWDFSCESCVILHYAAVGDCVELICYICNTGRIRINVRENNGSTPLHFAVQNNHYNAVKTLIRYGCNVNLKDFEGDTALDKAEGCDNNEIMQLLQQGGGRHNLSVR